MFREAYSSGNSLEIVELGNGILPLRTGEFMEDQPRIVFAC
jgi:hypothetical protein